MYVDLLVNKKYCKIKFLNTEAVAPKLVGLLRIFVSSNPSDLHIYFLLLSIKLLSCIGRLEFHTLILFLKLKQNDTSLGYKKKVR